MLNIELLRTLNKKSILETKRLKLPKIKLFSRFLMLNKFLTVFTVTGISLLAVNVDTYKRFKPNQSYATENNYASKGNSNVAKNIFIVLHKFDTKQNNLEAILAPNAKVEKIAGGFRFTEGAIWHPDGFLLFSDIPANTIYKWQPGQKTEIFRQPSGKSNGNTLDKSGRLITAEHGNRRVSLTKKNGDIVTLANRYQGKQLNSPNDLVVKSDGSIYFTDPPYGIKSEQEELGFYGVYRLAPDGTLTLLVDDFVRPNGIAFSPDETRLYVNDSDEGHIRVFDVQSDGTLANGKLFASLKSASKQGAADGMKVDIKGNVYSTAPGGVWIFAPDGELLGIIETPEPPSNIAWGDRDYKTLYITARNSIYSIRLNIQGIP